MTWDQGYFMDGSLISHKDYAYINTDEDLTEKYGEHWLKFKQEHGLLGYMPKLKVPASSLGYNSTITTTGRGFTLNFPGGLHIHYDH